MGADDFLWPGPLQSSWLPAPSAWRWHAVPAGGQGRWTHLVVGTGHGEADEGLSSDTERPKESRRVCVENTDHEAKREQQRTWANRQQSWAWVQFRPSEPSAEGDSEAGHMPLWPHSKESSRGRNSWMAKKISDSFFKCLYWISCLSC